MTVLMIIFLVVFILWAIVGVAPRSPTNALYFTYGNHTLLAILIGILGWVYFNGPHH